MLSSIQVGGDRYDTSMKGGWEEAEEGEGLTRDSGQPVENNQVVRCILLLLLYFCFYLYVFVFL